MATPAMSFSQQRQRRIALLVIVAAIATILLGNQPHLIGQGWQWVVGSSSATRAETLDQPTEFLVVAGGGAPSYNEIALEKNVLYFQRTLDFLGIDLGRASVFFANGNDGRATVRYLDPAGREQFKVPEIPNLQGAATRSNTQSWFQRYPTTPAGSRGCPAFFYFTGHGELNQANLNNNALIHWGEQRLSVQELGTLLDQWPQEIPFVTMMAQCYAGSFANLIYEGGDPRRSVALQSRCGFFATVKERPSVGCTPLVNEADYKDYSSSFFAGLSGRDRVGNSVPSADYDQDGSISYAEAHAFAKVDEETPDWPISTVEVWLQERATRSDISTLLSTPIATWQGLARPEQRYVITALAAKLGRPLSQPLGERLPRSGHGGGNEVRQAYHMRLRMELINVAMEQAVRASGDTTAIATLDKLLACEARTW
ncbi:hypothetical protein [Leptolyngbya sp. PCC 6406]|uniref:hypothetical protein n=1 Tax=Leptolyngbya sp. PCC 6406 TaxID=1173264 RepID=UPI0002ACC380|nr:hypothetical protein [Leptolyngbya sp. PCC 6406]